MTKVAIPTSPDELRDLLEDDTKRAEVFADKAATKEFLTAYARASTKGGDLAEQITEQVTANIATVLKGMGLDTPADKMSALRRDMNTGVPPATALMRAYPGIQMSGHMPSLPGMHAGEIGHGGIRNAIHNPSAPAAVLDGTYATLGELVQEIFRYRTGQQVHNEEAFNRVRQVTNAYSEKDPSTGGFIVPEEVRSTIMTMALEQGTIRPRATVITMSGLTTSMPAVDVTTHADAGSVFGGMVFYWVGESGTITPTEAQFRRVKLEANKLVGGARVPNELWSDAPALSTWLEMAAPMGIAWYEDYAFLHGNGVDRPLGILNASALVQADRATQDELTPADIYTMYSRMLPQSHGNAIWLVNQTLLPKLFGLSQLVGTTGGAPVNVLDITASPRMTLLGRPMYVTEKVPALANGAGNDILFIDPRYYLIGDRQAVSLDYSEHSRFMNDETELRIIERVDGRPWVNSALTPAKGSTTLSPYVGLTHS